LRKRGNGKREGGGFQPAESPEKGESQVHILNDLLLLKAEEERQQIEERKEKKKSTREIHLAHVHLAREKEK